MPGHRIKCLSAIAVVMAFTTTAPGQSSGRRSDNHFIRDGHISTAVPPPTLSQYVAEIFLQ
ncbi:Uncharacterised protein [Mycobacteroides abscessus subsp. abscessus]|nr:Uncharacterised protein [Mycobacteroides abscessus subsp. abscessus]SKX91582.1 Uncharacterised protein [Mycobacteroides abscessus subsp. abscessus]